MGLTNEHVGPWILAKIKSYVLTRAELLITLCYEIPCRSESMWAEIRFTSGLFEFWSDYITKIKKTFFKLILLPWWKKNLKEQKKHLLALPLGMSYYVIFSRQLISYKMKVWQLKKSKSNQNPGVHIGATS